MTRWILVLALVSAVPGCMRGCSWGPERADTCDDSSDCSAGTCRGGYCVDEAYARSDDDCHAGAPCLERGACTAIRKSSFLGVDQGFECGAVTHEGCTRSQRCATRDECALGHLECVRDWTACPALPSPAMPAWARPVDLVWEYDSLRTPWQPGEVARATLACRIEGKRRTRSTLRIAGHCAAGPKLDTYGGGEVLRVDVALHVGDSIAVAVQDAPIGEASNSSFAQLRYQGSSPVRGGRDGERIECVVVPHEVALARSSRELAAVDRELANADRERPDLARPYPTSHAVEAARVHAGRAARWLGWHDPELAARAPKIDAATASWQARLDTAIRALRGTAGPIRTKDVVVAIVGRVCGADVRARDPSGGAPPRSDDAGCANGDRRVLELAVDNMSDKAVWLSPASGIDVIDDLRWLRPAHNGAPAEVVPAPIIEIRVGATLSTIESVALPPGERALVLVGGLEDGAALHGRIAYTTSFALRP